MAELTDELKNYIDEAVATAVKNIKLDDLEFSDAAAADFEEQFDKLRKQVEQVGADDGSNLC